MDGFIGGVFDLGQQTRGARDAAPAISAIMQRCVRTSTIGYGRERPETPGRHVLPRLNSIIRRMTLRT